MRTLLFIGCAVALLGCDTPQATLPDGGGGGTDASSLAPPPSPEVDALPARAPYPVATLRGRSRARRVLVEGAGNPVASTVLPDGTFCADVPLRTPGAYALQVYAQAESGALSLEPVPVSTNFDPGAPAIPGASTCGGSDPAGCAGTPELCDDTRDNDCDGLADARDPDCAPCADDLLEPNDGANAPRAPLGRTEQLTLCPGNEDHYSVYLRAGEKLTARIFFRQAEGDLDLAIYDGAPTRVLARSASRDDDEQTTVTSTAIAVVGVRVYSTSAPRTSYVLDLSVE